MKIFVQTLIFLVLHILLFVIYCAIIHGLYLFITFEHIDWVYEFFGNPENRMKFLCINTFAVMCSGVVFSECVAIKNLRKNICHYL